MRKTFSQSDSSSLIKYARNLSNIELERGTYVLSITSKFHQNPTIPSEDIIWKTLSQSDRCSLIKYARNLSNIKLERGAYVQSITSKFYQNPTIPFQDIMRKVKWTDRQKDERTDGQGDYYRAPASQSGALKRNSMCNSTQKNLMESFRFLYETA
jgi:hypothetical protein